MAKTIGNSMRDMTSMRLDLVGNLDIQDFQHEFFSIGGVWWMIWLILSRDIISSGRISGFCENTRRARTGTLVKGRLYYDVTTTTGLLSLTPIMPRRTVWNFFFLYYESLQRTKNFLRRTRRLKKKKFQDPSNVYRECSDYYLVTRV